MPSFSHPSQVHPDHIHPRSPLRLTQIIHPGSPIHSRSSILDHPSNPDHLTPIIRPRSPSCNKLHTPGSQLPPPQFNYHLKDKVFRFEVKGNRASLVETLALEKLSIQSPSLLLVLPPAFPLFHGDPHIDTGATACMGRKLLRKQARMSLPTSKVFQGGVLVVVVRGTAGHGAGCISISNCAD